MHIHPGRDDLLVVSEGFPAIGQPRELSLRVRPANVEPRWAAWLMQTLGRYVRDTRKAFIAGDNLALERPIDEDVATDRRLRRHRRSRARGHAAPRRRDRRRARARARRQDRRATAEDGPITDLARRTVALDDRDVLGVPVTFAGGTDGKLPVARGAKDLAFSRKRLASIDLGALAGLPVETLALDENALATIDLRPLAGLPLRYLGLHGNQLATIDFAPLARCPSLEALSLSSNPLASLDWRRSPGSARSSSCTC